MFTVQKYWEVIDRTTGEVVDVNDWEVNEDQNRVLITKAIPLA